MKFKNAILQDEAEFARFLGVIQHERVRSYLEIGSKHGGSLWRVANVLPTGARVVAIDLPQGDNSFKETENSLRGCIAELKMRGYDAHLYLGDSMSAGAVAFAKAFAPFDCIFIDANHTKAYVEADWKNYSPLGKMIAFHDIGWIARPGPSKKLPIEVPEVWNRIKADYHHEEIRGCPRDNGIGVLWRS